MRRIAPEGQSHCFLSWWKADAEPTFGFLLRRCHTPAARGFPERSLLSTD